MFQVYEKFCKISTITVNTFHNNIITNWNFIDARSEGTGTGTLTEHSDTTNFSKCLIAIRRFFTFLFSHVGLLSMVVGYCILGGFTFEHLEKDNELQVTFWNVEEFGLELTEMEFHNLMLYVAWIRLVSKWGKIKNAEF